MSHVSQAKDQHKFYRSPMCPMASLNQGSIYKPLLVLLRSVMTLHLYTYTGSLSSPLVYKLFQNKEDLDFDCFILIFLQSGRVLGTNNIK